MNQTERRIFLLQELLKENPDYSTIQIPKLKEGQENLLRSLCNVRPPHAISDEFIRIQDEYLQEERENEDIVDSKTLPVTVDERITVWQGDITTLKVDGIVNAANSGMLGCFQPMHTCIDNIIHTKAGIQLRLACNAYMEEQRKQHGAHYEEPTGQAVITKGYNLPSSYVIHTVGPIVYGPLTQEHKSLLSSCYQSILDVAASNNLESVAFCCISTGVFMFPQDQAAEIAVHTVKTWLDHHPNSSVKKVIFNVFKDEDLELYNSILK